VRIELVEGGDITRRGVRDFSQAVELMNGVRVESNCQNCNTTEVQLLGLPGAYNQILFDGVPVWSVLGGVYGLEQIPAGFVDRIEVVKGGSSALYGAGAVGGVLNLIPARPRRAGGFVTAGFETQEGQPFWLAESRLDGVAGSGNWAVSAVGQAAENEAVDFDGDGFSEITERRRRVAGLQLWGEPSAAAAVTLNYQYWEESRRGGNQLEQPEWLANVAESLDTVGHRLGARWVQTPGPDWSWQATYGLSHITRDSFYGGLGDVETEPGAAGFVAAELDPTVPGSAAETSLNQYGWTRNPLHFGEVRARRTWTSHDVVFGVQRQEEAVRDENRDAAGRRNAVLLDSERRETGVFVQDLWTVAPGRELLVGARYDRTSTLDDGVLSPRAAWRQELGAVVWRASVATGFRAPEVFSEDLHIETLGAEPVAVRSAAGLREERALTWSTGLEWRPAAAGDRLAVEVVASHTDLRDAFVLGPVETEAATGELFRVRENAEGSTVTAWEALVAWQPNRAWRSELGLTWTQARFDEPQVVFDDTAEGGAPVLSTRRYLKSPTVTATGQMVWAAGAGWEAFAALKVTGPMEVLSQSAAELRRTPTFWVLDLGVTRHFDWGGRHVGVSVGVGNVFDERQRDLEQGVERDSDYVYGPRFGRAGQVRITYHF
jgi:outer membrane receptor for ferrienterochelin and colicins